MPHDLRKCRKNRGSRTCGWGKVGQHRDQGAKPERKSGRHKAKWSWVIRYEPDYFGKKRFTSPRSLRQSVKVINVGELDEVADRIAAGKDEHGLSIDLRSLGYTKLLGSGRVTKPLAVRVGCCSKSASQKIKDAGGEILAEPEGNGE